jgi:hypothetical protein
VNPSQYKWVRFWDQLWKHPHFQDEPGPSRRGWKAAAPARSPAPARPTLWKELFFLRGRLYINHLTNCQPELAQSAWDLVTHMMDAVERYPCEMDSHGYDLEQTVVRCDP